MPLTLPVVLFPSISPAGGNHLSDTGGLEFSLSSAFNPGQTVTVEFWPTGSATNIASAQFRINAGAFANLTLNNLNPGGGRSALITISGTAKDRNTLQVQATDNLGNTKTASVAFYLRGTGSYFGKDESDQHYTQARPLSKKTPAKTRTKMPATNPAKAPKSKGKGKK